MACSVWFAIAPLLPEIRESLELDTKTIWTSSICSVAGTLLMRLALGPLCDKVGPRPLFAGLLFGVSIATAFTGVVSTGVGLAVLRFFIGFSGGTFVLCQGWASHMFSEKTIGTAISLIAGWGNLASGITQLIMGSALFPLFKVICGGDTETAWRTVCIVPAVAASAFSIFIFLGSDDTPRGNFHEMKKHGILKEVSLGTTLQKGGLNFNTWLLFIQNAAATGVELTMNNAGTLYFQDRFGLKTESAAAIASIVGWMGITCALGGYLSDKANAWIGLKGRLWLQTLVLACEGASLIMFANTNTLGQAIAVMVAIGCFVQAAVSGNHACNQSGNVTDKTDQS
jgi:MFS transporter, NNP family, nitrate/nitrite transporter